MNQPLITIIVPVYNTESYLSLCLDGLIHQTYRNLEILLIDDGSTDRSLSLCQAYAEQNERVKVYHQEKSGVSAARNLGLKQASGQYINFIDSDDYVDEKFIETLYTDLTSGDYDLSIIGHKITHSTQRPSGSVNREPHRYTWDQKTLINGLYNKIPGELTQCNDMLFMVVWNKLYKKELLEGLSFSPVLLSEDLEFNTQVYLRTRKAIFNDTPLYYYFQRNDSAAHQLVDKVQAWNIQARLNCLQILPVAQKEYRANCLMKLYKTIFIVRYHSRHIACKDDKKYVEHVVRKANKQTMCEVIRNTCIPFRQKFLILIFYYVPGLYTLLRSFNDLRAKHMH